MKLYYDKDYSNTKLGDITPIQEVLKFAGAIVDIKILPWLQEAEKGDYVAMRELWTMFVYGTNQVKPNYKMAKRYFSKLNDKALASGEPVDIAQAMMNEVHMMQEFETDYDLTLNAMLKAFKYMVNETEFDSWDLEFFNYAQKRLEIHLTYPE